MNFNLAPSTTNLYGSLLWTVSRDAGSTLPSSITAAFQSETSRAFSVQEKSGIAVKAGSSQEMLFNNVRATGASWKVIVNADSLTGVVVYGLVYVEYLVQFRNRA